MTALTFALFRKSDRGVSFLTVSNACDEVLKTLPSENRVLVQGVNVVTKHNKPSQLSAGGIEKKEMPIHISNVAVADPKSGNATRVGYKALKDGKKVRVARKSGETIE